MSEMGAFTVHQDGQAIVIFYRHISRMVYAPDKLVVITDDGAVLTIMGRDNVAKTLETMRPSIPETVDILLRPSFHKA